MNVKDLDHNTGHEIDPNLVEIAEMQRIREEMRDLNENTRDRMQKLMHGRRTRSLRSNAPRFERLRPNSGRA
jgi:hypothetical protein